MAQDTNQRIELQLVSNFNLANLAAILNKERDTLGLGASCAPFGQVMQTLLDPTSGSWGPEINGAVVWTSPESVSSNFRRLLEGYEVDRENILQDVRTYCEAVAAIPVGVKHIFVPSWSLGPTEGRLGLLDMDARRGTSLALLRMNLALTEYLANDARIFVLDSGRWLMAQGRNSLSERLWYMSKTPFSAELFKVAALEIQAAVAALRGQARKLIVVDLDDTLWGGIVGDVGWQNLRLGGHDPVGEAYKDFQTSLKTLKQRGILLGIASKNEEGTALDAIRSHPEMLIRQDDFAGWRINWNDKAQNIADLASELNLGLQSVVFIDDNPVERARVRESLPEVLVPDWPESPLSYKSALQSLRCFDQPLFTAEDKHRSEMYVAERKRRESYAQVGSLDSWLVTLGIEVRAEKLDLQNLDRAVQLLNKTNQMNLTTRRLTKDELWEWSRIPGNTFVTFRVSDKYGDYGLVGLGSWSMSHGAHPIANLVDFVLSCRVMGRNVEKMMLHVLSRGAQAGAAKSLSVEYQPTSKNQPCLQFFQGSGLSGDVGGALFTLDLSKAYARPSAVRLELAPGMEVVSGGST